MRHAGLQIAEREPRVDQKLEAGEAALTLKAL
jgi:hypothetical protein